MIKHAITVFSPSFLDTSSPSLSLPTSVRRDDVQNLLESGAQLVDVLSPAQYADAHLPGAVNLPLGTLNALTVGALKADQPVIVYCHDSQCDLSARAAWRLADLGFAKVFRYTGGMVDWLANGLPVEGRRQFDPRVGQLARPEVPTCRPHDRVDTARAKMSQANLGVCVVVNEAGVILGLLRTPTPAAADDLPVDAVMDGAPRTYRPDANPAEAAAYMHRHDLDSVLVSTSDGRLAGLLWCADAQAVAGIPIVERQPQTTFQMLPK